MGWAGLGLDWVEDIVVFEDLAWLGLAGNMVVIGDSDGLQILLGCVVLDFWLCWIFLGWKIWLS